MLAALIRRGRACRPALVALRQAAKVWSGGVTSAERLSVLPAITNRATISLLSFASKKLRISVEYRPQADTGLQPTIIEQEGGSPDSVCADDALVAVHSQQHDRLRFRRLYVLSLKRRLTLDVAARVTRIGRAEPQTRRVSRGPA
jgi:hypothetical protein